MAKESDLTAEDPAFEARIDQLLSSALADQAKEQRLLVETVHGARAALDKAEEQLSALRRLIDTRDQAVVDLLEARLSGLGTEESIERVASRLEEFSRRPGLEEAVAPISAEIRELADRLDSMGSSFSDLDRSFGERIDALARYMTELDPRRPAAEIQQALDERMGGGLAQIEESLHELAELVSAVAEPISASFEQRLDSLRSDLDRLMTEVSERGDSRAGSIIDRLQGLQEGLTARLSTVEESVAGDVDVAQEALAGQLEAALRDLESRLTEKQASASAIVAESVDAATSEMAAKVEAALQDAQQRADDVKAEFLRSVVDLEATVESSASSVLESVRQSGLSTTEAARADSMQRAEELRESLLQGLADLRSLLESTSSTIRSDQGDLTRSMEEMVGSVRQDVLQARTELLDMVQRETSAVAEALASSQDQLRQVVQHETSAVAEALAMSQDQLRQVVQHETSAVAEALASSQDLLRDVVAETSREQLRSSAQQLSDLAAEVTHAQQNMGEAIERASETARELYLSQHANLRDRLADSHERTADWLSQVVAQQRELWEHLSASSLDALAARSSDALDHMRSVLEEATHEQTLRSDAAMKQLIEERELSAAQAQALMTASASQTQSLSDRVDELATAVSDAATKLPERLEEHLQSARTLDESRMEGVLERISGLSETVRSAAAEVPTTMGGYLEEARARDEVRNQLVMGYVEEMGRMIQAAMNELPERVESRMERSISDTEARNAEVVDQVSAVRSLVTEEYPKIKDSIAQALVPFATELQSLSERIRQSNRRITESNSRVEAMHESLIAYLSARDDQLERTRDEVLGQLIDRVMADLKHRDRVRIGAAMKEAEQRRKDKRDAERWRKLDASRAPAEPQPTLHLLPEPDHDLTESEDEMTESDVSGPETLWADSEPDAYIDPSADLDSGAPEPTPKDDEVVPTGKARRSKESAEIEMLPVPPAKKKSAKPKPKARAKAATRSKTAGKTDKPASKARSKAGTKTTASSTRKATAKSGLGMEGGRSRAKTQPKAKPASEAPRPKPRRIKAIPAPEAPDETESAPPDQANL